MIRREHNGVVWLEFAIFQGFPLEHAYFLKEGGVSQPPYASLNFSYYTGDQRETVDRNFSIVMKMFPETELALSGLVHGKKVAVVDGKCSPREVEADGLVTDKRGLMLMTTFADCQCALIYDPKHHAVANIHSGWKGNVSNIYGEAVAVMKEVYGSNPKDLRVGIGPSLGPIHAEFKNYASELPEAFLKYRLKECHFNFWKIARDQFEEVGVLSQHIEIAEMCTFQEKDLFFSYRREKITGRHAGVIVLR